MLAAIAAAAADVTRYPDGNGFALKAALAQRARRRRRRRSSSATAPTTSSSSRRRRTCVRATRPSTRSTRSPSIRWRRRRAARIGVEVPARDFGHDLPRCARRSRRARASCSSPIRTIRPARGSPPAALRSVHRVGAARRRSSCSTRRTTSISNRPTAATASAGSREFPHLVGVAVVLEGVRTGGAARRLRRHGCRRRRHAESRAPAVQRQRARAGGGHRGARRRRVRRREPRAQPRGTARSSTPGFDALGLAYAAVARQFRARSRSATPRRSTRRCCAQGVIVRPVANYGLPEWLRVSVGLPAENERFLAALATALGR